MASSSETQYGIDAVFVSDIPKYLTCAVCQLVLRNPLQISQCGHKFCTPCFDKLKRYARSTNLELVCPIDREVVDMSCVFEDKSIAMVIGGLEVKCSSSDLGCTWVGEFSELTLHERKCGYKAGATCMNSDSAVIGSEEFMSLFKDINDRMDEYEGSLLNKEKDIAHLKHVIQEVECKLNVQINKTTNLEEKLNQGEKDRKQCETKLENLSLKNIILEQNLEVLQNNMSEANQQLQENKATIIELKNEVHELKTGHQHILHLKKEIGNVKQHSIDMALLKKELVETKSSQKKSSELEDLKSVTVLDEIDMLKNSFNTSLNKQCSEINDLTARVDGYFKNCRSGAEVCPEQASIADLKASVANIENVMFCDNSTTSKDIVLQWILQGYQEHADNALKVLSPVFNTQLGKYRFQLVVEWKKRSGALGVFLRLHRADTSSTAEELNCFRVPYSFELTDRYGKVKSKPVSLADIDDNREKVTIPPHELYISWGYPSLLDKTEICNYLVNDSLRVVCRLKPS